MVALVAAMLFVLSVSPEAFGARSGIDGTAAVDVRWDYSGSHSIDGASSPPTVRLPEDDKFDDKGGNWYLGPKGPVRRAFLLTSLELQAGGATLTAEPGSLLAEMVGETTTHGLDLIARFHFDAKPQVAGW